VAQRQTKIVATLGPASSTRERIVEMVRAGMNVARLNFSHGDHDNHRQVATWVREAADEVGTSVALLQDIQGPKIRVGTLDGGQRKFEDAEEVELYPVGGRTVDGGVPIDYPHLLDDVEVGHQILLADGMIRMEAIAKGSRSISARVRIGGTARSNAGVAFPHSELRASAVTRKDIRDLEFGAEIGVDLIAASFVRSGADVRMVTELAGGRTPVIAKIELAAAYDRLDGILDEAAGVMVARGDLGVQLPLQRIPRVQRDILRRANSRGAITITATEMLESMTNSQRPTRAEVTDVATAVLAGTDAVMLSAESAIGKFPVRSIEVMDIICREVESDPDGHATVDIALRNDRERTAAATARAAAQAAGELGIETIVAFSDSGATARLISKHRPGARIVAFTSNERTYRQMALLWGVRPVLFDHYESTDELIAGAERRLLELELCRKGETVVMVAGIPPGHGASTNILKFHEVGEGGFSGRR
jgi:pyruvate kinase